jgi:hypothetical protein
MEMGLHKWGFSPPHPYPCQRLHRMGVGINVGGWIPGCTTAWCRHQQHIPATKNSSSASKFAAK